MANQYLKWYLMSATVLAGMAAAVPAHAQTGTTVEEAAQTSSSSTTGSATDPARVDDEASSDIIITATRRADRLSNVPIAVSVVTQSSLQNSGANDIRQLNQLAPSLLVSSTGSEANGTARIRGIGTVGDNPGLESSVAVFIDGVYRSRTGAGLSELGEIDRIEVLRGPQGTLFGRNASAGLLNIVSKAPSFEFGGVVEATYQNYDGYRLSGGVTGPLSKTVAGRIDGVYFKRDGFYKDVNTGDRVNNRDRYLVRGQLLWEPTADISFRLIGDYTDRDEDCCAAVFATTAINPANAGLISIENPIVPVLISVANTTFDRYFPAANDPYSRRIATTPGRDYSGGTTDWGVSGQLDWTLGAAQLTSITAYRDYKSTQALDADYGLADILFFGPNTGREFETFSQELRLQGSAFSDRLDWLVGGYYANEDLRSFDQLGFGSQYGAFASCRLVATISTAIPRDPAQAGCRAGPGGATTDRVLRGIFGSQPNQAQVLIDGLNILSQVNNVGDDEADYRQNSENFAFFTHNIIRVTPTVSLTLGARYTNETKKFSAAVNNNNVFCPAIQATILPYLTGAATTTVPSSLLGGLIGLACQGNSTSEINALDFADRRKENKVTGTAVLSWKPSRNLMLYASYSRGYKAGGFNLDKAALKSPILPFSRVGGAATVSNLQFEEETVDAYEAGAKYSRGKVIVNIAAFRQEFSSFQLNTFNGTVFLVQNINGCADDLGGADRDNSATTGACNDRQIKPGLVSQGVELEASVSPLRYFTYNLGITYARTRYAGNLVGSDTGTALDPSLRLLPGSQVSNAPAWVATSSATFTPPIGSTGMTALFYIDGRLSDGYNTASDLFPQKRQQSFFVMNARIGLRGKDQAWAIELWGQNILDQDYTQVAFGSPFQSGGAFPATQFPADAYPAGNQITSAYLAEPRTYGVTLRSRF